MSFTPVRIGLIGAGRIGASHSSVIARRVPEAQLVAVADPRPGVAAELAEPLGARGETSPEAIFAADDVDAVVIAASSTAHSELIVAAADAGKHVFSEKPAGMSLAEIEQGIAATAKAGVAFQVGFNRRFAADFRAAHEAIVAGRHRHGPPAAFGDARPGIGSGGSRCGAAVDDLHPDADPRLRHAQLAQPRCASDRCRRDG